MDMAHILKQMCMANSTDHMSPSPERPLSAFSMIFRTLGSIGLERVEQKFKKVGPDSASVDESTDTVTLAQYCISSFCYNFPLSVIFSYDQNCRPLCPVTVLNDERVRPMCVRNTLAMHLQKWRDPLVQLTRFLWNVFCFSIQIRSGGSPLSQPFSCVLRKQLVQRRHIVQNIETRRPYFFQPYSKFSKSSFRSLLTWCDPCGLYQKSSISFEPPLPCVVCTFFFCRGKGEFYSIVIELHSATAKLSRKGGSDAAKQ